jgi:LacI family transcriptional regulator
MKNTAVTAPAQGRVTIRDIAKIAGVSIGTVSRVINQRKDVQAELRDRVEKVMQEINYHPNPRAQAFARNSTHILSFLVSNSDLLHPFHSRILMGVAKHCEQAGFLALYSIYQYLPDTPAQALDLPAVLQRHGVAECMILSGTNYPNLLECLEERGVNFVLLGNNYVSEAPRPPMDQVRFDDFGGAYEATSYLLQLGHRDIWYIGDTSLPWYRSRYEGFSRAMTEAGLTPHGQIFGISDDRFVNGLRSAEMILEQGAPITAIFAGTDDMAYGAMEALSARGLSVPKDVSVVGFDDQRYGGRARELTTVRVEAEEIGAHLARMAISKIQSPGKTLPEVVVPTQLIRRGTCQPLGKFQ